MSGDWLTGIMLRFLIFNIPEQSALSSPNFLMAKVIEEDAPWTCLILVLVFVFIMLLKHSPVGLLAKNDWNIVPFAGKLMYPLSCPAPKRTPTLDRVR